MRKKIFLLALVSLFFAGQTIFAQVDSLQQSINKTIEEYAEQVRKDWKIPGMGMSIVKDGKLVYAGGFGVKQRGTSNPVDENTLFQVGSVSKSFTAAVVASLVDEGLVKWEDTVKNILPDFKMYDKWVEQNMLVKDMMTHKTGLKGQVGTYIPNLGYDRDDVYEMLGLLKPEYSFRNVYAYNNITFIIASKLIEELTGRSWEENVQERLFDRIGMTATSLNGEGYKAAIDAKMAALPHSFWFANDSINVWPIQEQEDMALHWLTVVGPAGSVVSSVNDMAKWAQFHLDKGIVSGDTVITPKNVDYLHRGLTITSQDTSKITLYGHCWFKEQNNRYQVIFHTGTTWGQTALCFFVPELDLGGMILVNSEAGASPRYAIMRRLIDLYMGAPEYDYNKEYLEKYYADSRAAAERRLKREAERGPVDIKPAPKDKALVGKYVKDELFGDARVSLENKELYITIGKYGWKHKLIHVDGNRYKFDSDGHTFPIVFNMNEKENKSLSFIVEFNYGEENSFGGWTRK